MMHREIFDLATNIICTGKETRALDRRMDDESRICPFKVRKDDGSRLRVGADHSAVIQRHSGEQ